LTTAGPSNSPVTNSHDGAQALDAELAPAAGTAGRVGEDGTERSAVHGGGVRNRDRAGQTEDGEVGAGQLDPHLVEVDSGRRHPRPRDRDQVAADAAPEVEHGPRVGRHEPGGAVLSDPGARRLLEGVGGEVEAEGLLAQLGHRPHPETDLGEGRGCLLGARARKGPHGARCAYGVAVRLGVRRRRLREDALTVVGQQPACGLQVHPADPGRDPAAAVD